MGVDSCPKHPIAKRERQNRDIPLIHELLRRFHSNSARLLLLLITASANLATLSVRMFGHFSAAIAGILGVAVPGITLAESSKTRSAVSTL
jgi:hypothetical protein